MDLMLFTAFKGPINIVISIKLMVMLLISFVYFI